MKVKMEKKAQTQMKVQTQTKEKKLPRKETKEEKEKTRAVSLRKMPRTLQQVLHQTRLPRKMTTTIMKSRLVHQPLVHQPPRTMPRILQLVLHRTRLPRKMTMMTKLMRSRVKLIPRRRRRSAPIVLTTPRRQQDLHHGWQALLPRIASLLVRRRFWYCQRPTLIGSLELLYHTWR